MAVSLRRLLAAMLAVAAAVALRAAAESEPGWDVAAPDLLYAEGTAAYARGDWPGVVLNMERALRSRAALRALRLRCRTRCATELPWAPDLDLGPAPSLSQDPGAAALHDLRFFGAVLRRAACLRRCLGPPSAHLLSEELDLEFNKRSPYNYLQVAYFKVRLVRSLAAGSDLGNLGLQSRDETAGRKGTTWLGSSWRALGASPGSYGQMLILKVQPVVTAQAKKNLTFFFWEALLEGTEAAAWVPQPNFIASVQELLQHLPSGLFSNHAFLAP